MSKQSPAQAEGRDQQASGAWQWGRTPQTRRVLLNAAREVFAEQGFAVLVVHRKIKITEFDQRHLGACGSPKHPLAS